MIIKIGVHKHGKKANIAQLEIKPNALIEKSVFKSFWKKANDQMNKDSISAPRLPHWLGKKKRFI